MYLSQTKESFLSIQEQKLTGLKNYYFWIGIAWIYSGFFCYPVFGQNQQIADSLIQILSQPNDLSTEAICRHYNKIAFNSAKSEDALLYANKALSLATGHHHLKEAALSHRHLGTGERRKGNYVAAIEHYLAADEMYNTLELVIGNGVVNLDLAALYQDQGHFDNSKGYYQGAITIFAQEKDTIRLGSSLLNIGELYRLHDHLDSALYYFNSASELFTAISHESLLAYAKGNIGMVNLAQEDYALADQNIRAAIAVLEPMGDVFPVAVYRLDLATIHLHQGAYALALAQAEQSLSISKAAGLVEQIRDANLKLSEISRLQSAYERAYHHQSEYLLYRDSINNEETTRQIADLRTTYEVSKKQSEVDLLEVQNQQNKMMLYGAIIGVAMLTLIALVIFRALVINRRLSKENKRQADRLTQLDAAKSRFFANISHDLRSPLTLIMGGLGQVLSSKDVYLTEKAERQLKVAQLNSERIIHLTNEINELIQLEDGKLQLHKKQVNIDEMLSLLCEMFVGQAQQKGVNMVYQKEALSQVPILEIDPLQFERVMFNLITNALKHTTEGDEILMSLTQATDQLQIRVKDTGEGISPQKLPYIFERYFQAPDANYKAQVGFGIGLALVQEIINQHEATIGVESELNKGSVFMITIPLVRVPQEALHTIEALSFSDEKSALFRDIDDQIGLKAPVINFNPEEDEGQHTILIVEDHPEVRAFIQDIVGTQYQVLLASNGHKALQVLEKEKVDLVITDLMMPIMDGFELLEAMKQNGLRKIPALVLSARTSEEDKQLVLAQGVNDFLFKPFNPDELLMRIDNLLSMKELWNANELDELASSKQETLDDIEKALLKKVERLIIERVEDTNLNIGYLADQVAVSERKYYRLIKKLTGNTPLEMIKEIRLQMAHKLLTEKNIKSASEVAKLIGIANVTNFNTQFKKRFGKTPNDMMKG